MNRALLSVFNDDPEILALLRAKRGELPDTFMEAFRTLLKGDAGDTPVKGDDYFTEAEITAFKKEVTPVKYEDYFTDTEVEWILNQVYSAIWAQMPHMIAEVTPQKGVDYFDGKDADELDIDEVVEAVKKKLPKSNPIAPDFSKIETRILNTLRKEMPDFDAWLKEIKTKRLIELRDIRGARLDSKASGGFNMNDQRWHGAGGTTSGGANVTTQYLLTAVQSGSDVTIDLTQLANWGTFDQLLVLNRNNVPQTEGASYNFTIAGSVATVFNADASEIFNATYSYS